MEFSAGLARSSVDEGDAFFLVALTVISGWWTICCMRRLWLGVGAGEPAGSAWTYVIAIALCLGGLEYGLRTLADGEVRGDGWLQALFVAGGMTAIAVATEVAGLLGVNALADGIERRNRSARIAVVGLWIATTVCSIGANIGEGDTIGTTFGPLTIALGSLLLVLAVVSAATRGYVAIAMERSMAAGWRFAGLAIGASLPLAQAASGDWVSIEATLDDFVRAAPVLLALLAAAVGVEGFVARRPVVTSDVWSRGIAPAAVFLAIGGTSIAVLHK